MSKYQILITNEAEQDMEDLYDYIAKQDQPAKAAHVLGKLEEAIFNLEDHPERGHYPDELSRLGIKNFREVFFKPYRVIYEILDKKIIIHICVDGRRDMKTLLNRRLVR